MAAVHQLSAAYPLGSRLTEAGQLEIGGFEVGNRTARGVQRLHEDGPRLGLLSHDDEAGGKHQGEDKSNALHDITFLKGGGRIRPRCC